MRRYLIAGLVLVAFVVLAVTQRTISASYQGGDNQNYLPIVLSLPTPTALPTPVASATPTMPANPNAGSGIYKKDGNTAYSALDYANTNACGFIRFFDGSPAFGGPEGLHADVCPDATGRCYPSTDLDASGYFQVDIEAFQRLTGDGYFRVYEGDDDEFAFVSNQYGFDFDDGPPGIGITVRMDFIECRVGEEATNPRCRLEETAVAGTGVAPRPNNPFIPETPYAFCPDRVP